MNKFGLRIIFTHWNLFLLTTLIFFIGSRSLQAGKLFYSPQKGDTVHYTDMATGKKISGPHRAGGKGYRAAVWGWVTVRMGHDYTMAITTGKGPFNSLEITFLTIPAKRTPKGVLIFKQWFKRNGEPAVNKEGIHVIANEYDSKGKKTYERYFDRNLRPAENKKGIHFVKYELTDSGFFEEVSYFNIKGKPAQTSTGIHKIEYDFSDSKNHYMEIVYYGINGEKAVDKNGVHQKKYHSNRGALISYGPDGKEVFTPRRERRDWKGRIVVEIVDRKNNLLEQSWFDTSRRPIYKEKQIHKAVYTYNEKNQRISERYYDKNSRPTINKDSIHCIKKEYDKNSGWLLKSNAFYDVRNKPVNAPYHRYEVYYVKNGESYSIAEEKWFDKKGQLTNKPKSNYARVVQTRHSNGRLKSEAFFDKQNKPVKGPLGYYSQTCDDDGNCKYQYSLGK